MSPAGDAVTELDRLLLEDPTGDAFDDARLVAGDLLLSRGHIRGEHIVHERACTRAQTHAQTQDASARIAAESTYQSWLAQHEAAVFGSLSALRHRRGAMRPVFRGGRMLHLTLDARRVVRPGVELNIGDLMTVVLTAPALRRLQSLVLRVRDLPEAHAAQQAILKHGRKLALERLMISPTTRPLGHAVRGQAGELRKRFPQLWLATHAGQLVSLLDPELPDETTAHELEQLTGRPMSRELRVHIGRGLGSGREQTTRAACKLIAGFGASAAVFLPTLELLLRPKVSHAAAWVLAALPSFDSWADPLIPRVRRITGDAGRYPRDIRSAAGRCVRALEAQLVPLAEP